MFFVNSKKYTYATSIMSFFLAMLVGWLIHFLSHTIDYEKLYDVIQPYTLIRFIPGLDHIIRKCILYTLDFHDKIHHMLIWY